MGAIQAGSPVECLGLTFESEEERRAYFLTRLREKLRDPEFRKIKGFPAGSDEDILRLSDPPYYTACPNPFLADFIRQQGSPYDPGVPSCSEAFAADTTAGKTHPIYTAHSYHSKIPHLAIMPCILHYTRPGDLVLDAFAGSGMTGVAAQLCGRPEAHFKASLEQEWASAGHQLPRWGARRALLTDLSPAAGFIAYNLNRSAGADAFERAAAAFFARLDAELGWMYQTMHVDGTTSCRINYVIWSGVFACPHCAGDLVLMAEAYQPRTGRFAPRFDCPHCCHPALTRRSLEHRFTAALDPVTGETVRRVRYVPVEIDYTIPGSQARLRKTPDEADLALLARLEREPPRDWIPTEALPLGAMRDSSHLAERGITRYHRFYLPRPLHALAAMWRIAGEQPDVRIRNLLRFMVEPCFAGMSLMNGYEAIQFGRLGGASQVGRVMKDVYYVRPVIAETSPWYNLDGKCKRLARMIRDQLQPSDRSFLVSTQSALSLPIPDNTVDYIYTDPPFGDAVKYGDLNLLIEAWHRVHTRIEDEVLWDELKQKDLGVYAQMMREAFALYYRVLKPGRWMTVVFHNSKSAVWAAIQEAIDAAGFVVAEVRMLNRQQGSFNQVTAAGAVKHDLVISAYRPGGVGRMQGRMQYAPTPPERFQLAAGTEEGAWDFVANRLRQLPVATVERTRHLLFDRMVAFHLQRGLTVPLAAPQFYAGLEQRFPHRDGRYFLLEQMVEEEKDLADYPQAIPVPERRRGVQEGETRK